MGVSKDGGLTIRHGLAHLFLQRAAFEEGHHQVRQSFLVAVIQHLQNIRVIQLRQRFGFALEALEELTLVIHFNIRADDLDGHMTFQGGVERLVDRRHAALSQRLNDVVTAQVFTDQIIHRIAFLPEWIIFMNSLYRNPEVNPGIANS